ncbi:MAG: universal stress protein [Bacteriovoracaceae bacterium]
MKHIVIASDFSENSAKALEWALNVARDINSEIKLTIMHCHLPVNDVVSMGFGVNYAGNFEVDEEEVKKGLLKDLKEQVEKISNNLKTPLNSESISFEIKTGSPVNEITHYCQSTHADLLILGLKGHSFLEKVFLGSIAENLYRQCQCSILGIHAESKLELKTIFYPCDFHASNQAAYKMAQDLQKAFNAKVFLYHVINPQSVLSDIASKDTKILTIEEALEKAKVLATDNLNLLACSFDSNVEVIVEKAMDLSAENHILEKSAQIKPDLIIVGSHQKKGFERFFLGSTSDFLVRRSQSNILVAKG